MYAVDALSMDPSGLTPMNIGAAIALTPPMLIVGYGVSRIGASLCNEMRNAVFAKLLRMLLGRLPTRCLGICTISTFRFTSAGKLVQYHV